MKIFNLNDEPHCSARMESKNPIHFFMKDTALSSLTGSLYEITDKTGFIIYESANRKTVIIFLVDTDNLNIVTVPDVIILSDKERKLFKNCRHINPTVLTYVLLSAYGIRVYNINEISQCYEQFANKYFHLIFLSGQLYYESGKPELKIEYIDAEYVTNAICKQYENTKERTDVLGSGVNTIKDNRPQSQEVIDTSAIVYDGLIEYNGKPYILTDNLKEKE